MRILYNSKNKYHKTPFGCLRTNENCTLKIDIPKSCQTKKVQLCIKNEDGFKMVVPFFKDGENESYETYQTNFSLFAKGLYFYYFKITTENEEFDLYKEGDDTNIGIGDLWQVTCFDLCYDTPDDFKGKVIYQIFPDRFAKSGKVNVQGKLEPYFIHESTKETPVFLPDENGKIINNDFFGGNLNGITEKLPYLKKLGVGIIYLNPIFFAYSNHRYDTADYKKIDPLLGTEDDFKTLCDKAHSLNIKIILDGVFSHTGSNSVYFDKNQIFGCGAVSSENSPYKNWFDFQSFPDKYTSWWGIDTLPCVNEMDESYLDYIINSEDSVINHWISLGADGFRLDVADELPDEFIMAFKKRLKEIKPNSLLIGEVWEDASNKISYGKRKKYFSESELDSVMNYPFKDTILGFIKGILSGFEFKERIMTIVENYPLPVLHCLMNLLSTHDTKRALTEISGAGDGMSKTEKANFKLTGSELSRAVSLLKAASVLQFTLPGNPCIYYGDEIGMEGFEDPLNREFFKWDEINCDLLDFYKSLAHLKNQNVAINLGEIKFIELKEKFVKYSRYTDDEIVYIEISLDEKLIQKEKSIIFVESDHVCVDVYKE